MGVCLLAKANPPQSSKPQKEQYRSKRGWRHRQCSKSLKRQVVKKRHPADPVQWAMACAKEEAGKPKPRRQRSLPVRLRMKVFLTPNLMSTLVLNIWTRHKPCFQTFSTMWRANTSDQHPICGHSLSPLSQRKMKNTSRSQNTHQRRGDWEKETWLLQDRTKSLLDEANTIGTRYNKYNHQQKSNIWLFFNIPLKQIVNHGLHYLIAFKRLLGLALMNVTQILRNIKLLLILCLSISKMFSKEIKYFNGNR